MGLPQQRMSRAGRAARSHPCGYAGCCLRLNVAFNFKQPADLLGFASHAGMALYVENVRRRVLRDAAKKVGAAEAPQRRRSEPLAARHAAPSDAEAKLDQYRFAPRAGHIT